MYPTFNEPADADAIQCPHCGQWIPDTDEDWEDHMDEKHRYDESERTG